MCLINPKVMQDLHSRQQIGRPDLPETGWAIQWLGNRDLLDKNYFARFGICFNNRRKFLVPICLSCLQEILLKDSSH